VAQGGQAKKGEGILFLEDYRPRNSGSKPKLCTADKQEHRITSHGTADPKVNRRPEFFGLTGDERRALRAKYPTADIDYELGRCTDLMHRLMDAGKDMVTAAERVLRIAGIAGKDRHGNRYGERLSAGNA
jgi:hypothetical protein